MDRSRTSDRPERAARSGHHLARERGLVSILLPWSAGLTPTSRHYTLEDDVSLQGFNAGPHVLQAEFVAKDHAPFDPRVIARVLFEHEPGTGAMNIPLIKESLWRHPDFLKLWAGETVSPFGSELA